MRRVGKKRRGFSFRIVTREDREGIQYLYFKTPQGSYHAFQEIPTKNALRNCGAKEGKNTRQMAKEFLGI